MLAPRRGLGLKPVQNHLLVGVVLVLASECLVLILALVFKRIVLVLVLALSGLGQTRVLQM